MKLKKFEILDFEFQCLEFHKNPQKFGKIEKFKILNFQIKFLEFLESNENSWN